MTTAPPLPDGPALAPPAVDPRALLAWLEHERPAMRELLERLVSSEAPEQLLTEQLEQAGLDVRAVSGGHLYARPRRRRHGAPRQLVLGRLHARHGATAVRRSRGRLYAPGAAEADGGLVVLAFALKALASLGLEPVVTPVVVVGAARGEPTELLDVLARGAGRALVLAPAEADGRLTIARRGDGRFTVVARGEAAVALSGRHAQLLALDDPLAGTHVEIHGGAMSIDGGGPEMVASVDVRAPSARAARRIESAIRALPAAVPGAVVDVGGGLRRPPLEPLARNRLLYGAAVRLGHELGFALGDPIVEGDASSANTVGVHAATLDGLGPRAGGLGTVDEHVVLASLPERAALLALLLLEPPPTTERPRPHVSRTARRIAVVGSPANESNLDIVDAWRTLGFAAELVPPARVRDGDVVFGRLDVLPTLDGIEPGLLELLLLERRGVRVFNGAYAIAQAHDKLLTARALARAGLPHPRTTHLRPDRPLPAVELPLVVKPRFGSWGADIFRCESFTELEACVASIRDRPWFRRHGALLQELVPPTGHDLRLIVAGGVVVGAVSRVAAPGEWRTNMSLGGSDVPVDPPDEIRRLGAAAAASIGGDVIGIDLLPLDDGYTIVELNGAVEFDTGYSLAGRDVFTDAAAALGIV